MPDLVLGRRCRPSFVHSAWLQPLRQLHALARGRCSNLPLSDDVTKRDYPAAAELNDNEGTGGAMETPQTKLLIPSLRPFYEWAEPVSWALVRITAGLMIPQVRLDGARLRVPAHVGPGNARDSAARWRALVA
jgi:hypothetical protein